MISSIQKFQKTTDKILHQLKSYGATDAELMVQSGVSRQVGVRDGILENAESAANKALSVRAYVGQKSASIHLTFDEEADYSSDLEDLILSAQMSPEDPYCGLADPDQIQAVERRDFDQFDPSPLLTMDELRERALELEKAASGPEIVVDQSSVSHFKAETFYAASNGLQHSRELSVASQSVVDIHQGEELTRNYASASKIYLDDLESLEETGKRAYERTWSARNPVRGPSGRFPVLFDERVASSLIGHLIGAMNAGAHARRASWLIDYEEPVLPASWIIRETPFRMRKLASDTHDGEGLLKRELALVEKGRPQLLYADLSAARQLEIEPTGHAVRGGINCHSGVESFELQAPFERRGDLLKSMGEGLLITGFIGATINSHTGDYSRGANGFWVRNGEICEAVNEITIASNLKTILPTLRAADDADSDKSIVVPSLLVEDMTIAGR